MFKIAAYIGISLAIVFGAVSAKADTFDETLAAAQADGCISVEEGKALEATQGSKGLQLLTDEQRNGAVVVGLPAEVMADKAYDVYLSVRSDEFVVIAFKGGCFSGMLNRPMHLLPSVLGEIPL